MKEILVQIQVFYEIAMAIGKSRYLRPMLRESLSVYLRKLCCSTGIIMQAVEDAKGVTLFKPLVAIPYKAHLSPIMEIMLRQIPTNLSVFERNTFQQSLPLTIQISTEKQCYLMHLPGFGLMVLLKSGEPFSQPLIKSLVRLNSKLADACLVCLHHEETARINDQLKREIGERMRAEAALRQVLDELESRVADRTRELVDANHKLEEALANVKMLSGMLPICVVCKKIRDDQGYWNQIEAYISAHTETLFSHGLCPECAKNFYGDLVDPEP